MYLITSTIGGTFGLLFLFLWVLLGIFAFFNILSNKNINNGAKLLWIIIIAVVPILGSATYLFLRSLKTL
ncbi:MAG: PLDc N-terminal domain-containing protein [Bacteroidetes bacterium]|jgi:uncharacterized membrane protein|nr:PLDc N-terminal domain-containing protein [Bacteroidota bacterium]